MYDLIFLIFTLIYLPIYLFKGKFHHGFLSRLGILPKDLHLDRPVWIHAVSLGEAISIRGLVEELRKAYPYKKFVFSTVTPTGNKIARELARSGDLVTYLPLDFSFTVRNVINRINPGLFIIAETEIWPNLITYLHMRDIPIVTVNGRISDTSFKGYSAIKFLISPILNKVKLFCLQSESDAARLRRLGVSNDKIKVTGNMKFDKSDDADFRNDYTDYRLKLGLDPLDKLLAAGSTHPGEEEIILTVYKSLLNEFSHLRLLIAPRHPERTSAILLLIERFGLQAVKISDLNSQTRKPANLRGIFILDTVGDLMHFYSAADIVFVGGSLIKRGGHNILEPASLGKPVIFGPHMFNFRDMVKMFLDDNAAIMARTQEELASSVQALLGNYSKAGELAKNAHQVISRNQGATLRNIEAIKLMGEFNGN
ncbi:MAG: 3-deoxy-D-manno-octulosonic acid transferase [Candidatus Omnitrophota bacterium]|nr:3-deoxy-D-manno-octulosonic acid transferase [Candidatus Omnitrophota bacterium]